MHTKFSLAVASHNINVNIFMSLPCAPTDCNGNNMQILIMVSCICICKIWKYSHRLAMYIVYIMQIFMLDIDIDMEISGLITLFCCGLIVISIVLHFGHRNRAEWQTKLYQGNQLKGNLYFLYSFFFIFFLVE